MCEKAVSNRNHRYVCADCKQITHAKCTRLALNKCNTNTKCQAWKCDRCLLQTLPFFDVTNWSVCIDEADESMVINESSLQTSEPWIIEERKRNSTDLLLVHLNVNSIQNKHDDLKILNRELKSHIIFLTETKIDSSYPSAQFQLEGYHNYRKDRAKGGGGVMAYVSSKIISRQMKLPKQYKLIEVLPIKTMINNNDVLFVGIYRPPKATGSNYYLKLEAELNSLCMWATMECATVILTGDLNLDRLRPESTEGKLLINLEEVYGLECLVTEPTRITCTSATLLDVILTNRPDHFRASGVFNPEISDHNLIYGVMKERVSQHQRKVITFRSTKALDAEKLNEDLKAAPWNVMDTFDTLEDKYQYWKSLFNSVVEEHMPTKKMRFRREDVPYMTAEWKKAIKLKRTYAKQYAHNRTEENWELKRKWRNEATKCRRRAIREYWQQKADHLKSKPTDFYKTFRPFLNDKNKGQDRTCINLRTNGEIVKDQNKVANILVSYFSTMADEIGGRDVNSLTEEDLSNHQSVTNILNANKNMHDSFRFNPLRSNQVQSALEKLNVRKASGYDSITPNMLKLTSSSIADSLTKLYNESIQEGEWPEAWKRGEWNPVFKKDDRLDEKNYRPITLLCTVDKVYEQLLSEQVNKHFDTILNPCLSAYRKNYSCETTLLRLTEEWKLAADSKQYVGVLSTDMSKAFDSLHPSLIINKLKAYGFSEGSLKLIRSYFNNRQNRVKLDSAVSAWKEAVRGCPQGSSFGPLLWNIFQNDMTYIVNNARLSMYADDHQMYVTGNSVEYVEQSLNDEGQTISRWYGDNFLKGNYDKFNAMLISRKNNSDQSINVNIDGYTIKSTPDLKLLGVTLDDQLKFSKHMCYL